MKRDGRYLIPQINTMKINNLNRLSQIQNQQHQLIVNKTSDVASCVAGVNSIRQTAKLNCLLEINSNLFNQAKNSFNINNILTSFAASSRHQFSFVYNNNNQLLFDYLSFIIINFFLTIKCLISQPKFELTTKHLIIKFFYFNYFSSSAASSYTKQFLNNYNIEQIRILIKILSKLLNRNIIIEMTSIQSPNLESTILAKTISIISDKFGSNFRNITNRIVNNSNLISSNILVPNFNNNNMIKKIAGLTGINFKLAGRLTRQTIIPRITVKNYQVGSLARKNTHFLTTSKFVAKNRKGIFCYTLTIGHRFY